MANATLDLGTALKLVEKYDGNPTGLPSFLATVELLKEYSPNVPEVGILRFIRTRLIGAAHGSIDESLNLQQAKETLKTKFTVRLTPRAVENELKNIKQHNKTISEFGAEIEKLTTKLAAAYVSNGTFNTEAAAENIVQPVAVQAFIEGLKNPQTAFFIKARNPSSLNKAISDALECAPDVSKPENVLWIGFQNPNRGNNNWRGRGNTRGNFRGRGRYPSRNNYRSNYRGSVEFHQYNEQRGNSDRGRGNYRPQQNNRDNDHHNNNNNNTRGRPRNHQANVAEQENNNNEEVNIAQLFRE